MAGLAAQVGQPFIALDLPPGTTGEGLRRQLGTLYPDITPLLDKSLLVAGDRILDDRTPLPEDEPLALIGAPHQYAISAEDLTEHRTDGHLDIDAVRPGAILIAPVKVEGAGVYMGDMHALQGDGEIAGHTMDVSGSVTLQVEVVKKRKLDGPVLFPLVEDLPPMARPFSEEERAKARRLAGEWGMKDIEESAPISVIGSGPDLNTATENGLRRAADLLGLSVAEIRNRATVTGAIEIGRNPGVIQVTFLAPMANLEEAGLAKFAREQYGL